MMINFKPTWFPKLVVPGPRNRSVSGEIDVGLSCPSCRVLYRGSPAGSALETPTPKPDVIHFLEIGNCIGYLLASLFFSRKRPASHVASMQEGCGGRKIGQLIDNWMLVY